MAKRRKSTQVVVKVDEALFRHLAALPNRSEFVRRAVLMALGLDCPLCSGRGAVPIPVGTHFAPIVAAHSRVKCATCQGEALIPTELESLEASDRDRWAEFFHHGVYRCSGCNREHPQRE